MNLPGLLSAAAEEVLSHKLRVALSILSIVVGVSSLTLIVAIGEMGRAAATVLLERQSGRSATLDIALSPTTPGAVSREEIATRLTSRLVRFGALGVSPIEVFDGGFFDEAGRHPVEVYGVTPDLATIRRLRMVEGRWLTESDASLFAPVVVVNRALAPDLGLHGDSLLSRGRVVLDLRERIAGRVVGIVDDGERVGRAYVPLASLDRWGRARAEEPVHVLAWVPSGLRAAISTQLQADAAREGLRSQVQRLDHPEALDETIRLLQLGLGAIAALSLVSGGLGIVNLGLVTIRYRAREFALRRAFGATKGHVFSIVLIESILTSVLAGFLGVGLALIGTSILPRLTAGVVESADLPGFPVVAAATGVLVSVLLGVLAGAAPAYRAVRLSIIDAIREQ